MRRRFSVKFSHVDVELEVLPLRQTDSNLKNFRKTSKNLVLEKSDVEKAEEERLLANLLQVVEKRNGIVQVLEQDRLK